MDIERITRLKRKADETAYQKGLREGFDQAAWFFVLFFIGIVWFFR